MFLVHQLNPGISFSAGYPQSLKKELVHLLGQNVRTSPGPATLVRLSELYLDLGDDLYVETAERLSAYQAGANVAERALGLEETNSRAHFFYAANLGSAAQLKGLFASMATLHKLKFHIRKSLELDSDFPPAVHMMGMLLEKLPWILGGNALEALKYLEKAVQLNPGYTRARLDLAKAYLERRKFPAARQELSVILNNPDPAKPVIWETRYRPEAERLLKELEKNEAGGSSNRLLKN